MVTARPVISAFFGCVKPTVRARPMLLTSYQTVRSLWNILHRKEEIDDYKHALEILKEEKAASRGKAKTISHVQPAFPRLPIILDPTKPEEKLPFFHYQHCPCPPQVIYTSDSAEANEHLSRLQGNVLGFDLEWPPFILENRAAMIQLCDENLVVLIHIGKDGEIPSKAIELLRDPKINKVGVFIGGDMKKLIRDFPHLFDDPNLPKPASILELSRLVRLVDPEWRGPGKRMISLAEQCEHYLDKVLDKDDNLRKGNWAGELDHAAIDYAANDVYSSILIYHKLISISKAKDLKFDHKPLLVDLDPPSKPKRDRFPTVQEIEAKRLAGPTKHIIAGEEFFLSWDRTKPTPAIMKAFEAFLSGRSIPEYANERGIKEITVKMYICEAVKAVGVNALSAEDQYRFFEEAWIGRPRM
ncbi:uncharacterized protein IL334_004366 [Kwoniella shivajii]|uniref:3'-5' exonuclease domain-containing protein n=1 Tax=Kwoniella shivajii TaxID=564305 RepID=A0ABZ1D0J0_9TREE|nr:hypothetical protein IL334_004366 [Kwoniella shivajii]